MVILSRLSNVSMLKKTITLCIQLELEAIRANYRPTFIIVLLIILPTQQTVHCNQQLI